MNINEKVLKSEFESILAGLRIRRVVNVIVDHDLHTLVGVSFDSVSVTLKYNALFENTCTTDAELRLYMEHEACHVLTLPDSTISTSCFSNPVIQSACVEYVDIFREFLAHKEFARRFAADVDGFLKLEAKQFQPEKYLQDLKASVADASIRNKMPLALFPGLLSIFYDATYFYVVQATIFHEWCKLQELEPLYQLFQYLMEDFESVSLSPGKIYKRVSLLEDSFRLAMNVKLGKTSGKDSLSFFIPINDLGPLNYMMYQLWQRRAHKS